MKVLERYARTENSEAKLPSDNDSTENLKRGYQTKISKPTFVGGNSGAKVCERQIPTQSSRAKLPNEKAQAKIPKRTNLKRSPNVKARSRSILNLSYRTRKIPCVYSEQSLVSVTLVTFFKKYSHTQYPDYTHPHICELCWAVWGVCGGWGGGLG